MQYPSQERQGSFYALRYVRWLIESETVVETGPDAFALLVAVVMAEDRIHYTRAPNFYNEQLQRNSGIGSEPALIRARKRAVSLGLLTYIPGAKRRPGVYFVTGFPNESLANDEKYTNEMLGKAEGIRRESVGKAQPSKPIPILNKNIAPVRCVRPTLKEVRLYCSERKNSVSPETFFDYYEANGWVQGKGGKPIRDWKAAVRTWENRNKQAATDTSGREEYPLIGGAL